MGLTGDHEIDDDGHVSDHNLIDNAIEDLQGSSLVLISNGTLGASGNLTIMGSGGAAKVFSILSSYDGGDDDGGGSHYDSTGRINLYAYQRANVGGYGESIRNWIMRSDAKTMQAWYMPVDNATKDSNFNASTRDPILPTSWKPVAWQGAHFEANDHGSIHGHWELEVPDASGALQGRLEIPFIDQSKLSNDLPGTTIGIAWTNIRTNLADFTVRAQNITSGDYSGQNTALRIGGNNLVHKDLLLSISSDMQNSGRRWGIRANNTTESGSGTNTGTDFQIQRYDDTGTLSGTGLGIERSTGNVSLGASPGGRSARLAAVWGTSGDHGFSAQPSATPGAGAAFDAQLTVATDRAVQTNVTGDANRRFTIYADGKTEWGAGSTARDANLYRVAASRLKTDTAFTVQTQLSVGAAPSSTDAVTVSLGTDSNMLNLTNTASGGNTSGAHIRMESAASVNSIAFSFRLTGDSSSRFLVTIPGVIAWGPGNASRDVNLYRLGVDQLKTDDKFLAALGIGVGNSAAATTLGTVAKKMQVFDASGSSLGYVPIYDAIT